MVGTFNGLRHIAIFWNTINYNVQSNTVVMRDYVPHNFRLNCTNNVISNT